MCGKVERRFLLTLMCGKEISPYAVVFAGVRGMNVTQPQIYVRPKPEKNEDISIVCRVAKTPFSYTIHNLSKPKNHFFDLHDTHTSK